MAVEIKRHFTNEDISPFATVQWKTVHIAGFSQPIEAPEGWSLTAIEIAARKYFRRGETSVRQFVHRVTETLRQAAQWQKTLDNQQARILADELSYLLLHQMGSFNSPVYFNLGVFPEFGIIGQGECFAVDLDSQKIKPLLSAYVRPQASACFIQDVQDNLVGIFDLLKSEAKLFKYGSGTGTNFSSLRAKGEPLEAGGESTGLLSYLEIFDKAAQAIKSGGTTRRAAKMVVLDADHPEILDFINWKMLEERKARVLLTAGYSGGMEGEAFRTVSGQNSNNSVRLTDGFLKRAVEGGEWELTARRTGQPLARHMAKDILRAIARAAWECADPGVQYHDTIQRWHTCPAQGPIRASNPCSEYMFLDNSACNLSSLNLCAFLNEKKGEFNWSDFSQAVSLFLIGQEVLVDYSSYPTEAIAENSHRYRPLGLGYANLGGLLMRMGIPYESPEALKVTQRITGAMHALALQSSLNMAAKLGAFKAWSENRDSYLRVLEQHASAWREADANLPWVDRIFIDLLKAAPLTGFRNAQVTLIAPTGTIGLLMDCDTLGIEPDFSLVKRKTLADGGELQLINGSVEPALARLGYSSVEREQIVQHVLDSGTIIGSALKAEHLKIFDCAVPPAGHPERRISVDGHLRVMAAAQPFLSGAISKTVNLPASTTIDEVENIFLEGWRLGLKSLAVYRDSSKTLQPLCAEC